MASPLARGQSNPADADQTGTLPEHKVGWEKMEKGSEKANGEQPAQRLTMVRWARSNLSLITLKTMKLANYFIL